MEKVGVVSPENKIIWHDINVRLRSLTSHLRYHRRAGVKEDLNQTSLKVLKVMVDKGMTCNHIIV